MRFVDEALEKTVKVDWRRVAVFVVAAVPYLLGALVGWIVNGTATVASWIAAGARSGYRDARSRR